MNRISFLLNIWQQQFSNLHIFAFSTETSHSTSSVHSRMFAPLMGISENLASGAYLTHHGIVPYENTGVAHIRSEQGIELGRSSFIDIFVAGNGNGIKEVTIGVQSVVIGRGEIYTGY